jgi:hypothetical protein
MRRGRRKWWRATAAAAEIQTRLLHSAAALVSLVCKERRATVFKRTDRQIDEIPFICYCAHGSYMRVWAPSALGSPKFHGKLVGTFPSPSSSFGAASLGGRYYNSVLSKPPPSITANVFGG